MKTALPHLAAIRVEGADGRDFLHRQLSADINGLENGGATFACLCQPKGRVIATVLVIADAETLWMVCSATLAGKVTSWLQRFVFRDDVRFVADEPVVVLGGEEGFSPLPGLAYQVVSGLGSDDSMAAEFRARELAAGVAWLDSTTSEAFLPQMIGADAIGALNYRKGCYPGQEIVARMHYLGKLKQRPVLAHSTSATAPAPMDKVVLANGAEEVEAQVVDVATAGDRVQLILVARAQAPVNVDRLVWESGEIAIEADWPEVETRQPKDA